MQRVRVKIEGLLDVPTAQATARMGADATGLVFAPSPRQVRIEQAALIVQALPPWVSAVGVFVDEQVQTINETVRRTGIGYVQLHGDERPRIVGQVRARCIKAFRVRDEGWLDEARSWLGGLDQDRANLAAIVLDAYDPEARGGTGKRLNWDLISQASKGQDLSDLPPIILAGGLDASCAAEAIRQVRPWALDVASGVESAPGVKDLAKVQAFLEAVRDCR